MKQLSTFLTLVDSFSKLPGIGVKSAERMAYAVLEMDEEQAMAFSVAIKDAKEKIHKCPRCGLYAEEELCDVCLDEQRDHSICAVVTYQKDALAFEKLSFSGIYHVLGGTLSPTKGIGTEELDFDRLLARIPEEGIKEIIIATNPTLDGETTALYLAKLLQGKGVKVTRLAYGLPMGSSLDYADTLTLQKALEGRKAL